MKILLINPEFLKQGVGSEVKFTSMPVYKLLFNSGFKSNLTLLTLAVLTPEEHTVEIIDDTVQSINFDGDYDLVGITVMTTAANRAYEISDEFRRRGKTVVLGGWHVSALPDEAKQHADSVVIGEAEDLWPLLLKDFSNGLLKPFYKQIKKVDLSVIPPLTDIRKMNKYGSFPDGVEATRGCTVGCKFCSATNKPLYREFRKKPIDNVIEEIGFINKKIFVFIDNSLTFDPVYAKQLFKKMKGLNKKFYALGNISMFEKDEELLKLAAKAGLMEIKIGLESSNQTAINSINKWTNKVNNYASVIKKIHDYGISVLGYFMFGLDVDTKDIFDETLDFVESIELDLTNFMILTPYPGTPIYDQLENESRILTKDWSKYDMDHVVFQPKNMTPEELLEGTQRVAKAYYSPMKTIKRIIRSSKIGFYPFLSTSVLSYITRRWAKQF